MRTAQRTVDEEPAAAPPTPPSDPAAEGTFTRYVRAIASRDGAVGGMVEELRTELRKALVQELRWRSLWASSPAYVGVLGWPTWTPGDTEGTASPLEDLLADCYLSVFGQRLGQLLNQLRVHPRIDGLVVVCLRQFLTDRQKHHDPLGYRLFEMLCAAVRGAVAAGELHVAAFRFKDLLDALKEDVRARWGRLQQHEDGETDYEEGDDGVRRLVRILRPETRVDTDLVAASFEALDRYEEGQEALSEGGERPPAPGDVYVLEATKGFGVEWAVVAHDPADASRFLVVPADAHVLAGSADIELEDHSGVGALKLRCRFGTWTDAALLRPELRVGALGTEGLVAARQRWLDVRDGEVTEDVLGREVDDDPGYQDWVDDVLVGARRALIEAQAVPATEPKETEEISAAVAEKTVKPATPPPRRASSSMFFRIAASIVVAVASVQLWRLSERVQDLEVASRGAEERHGAAIRQLETERDRIVAERDRLQARQQELEAAGAENEREARELRERVAVLDRRLEETSEVVNPAVAFYGPPEKTQRGEVEVRLRPEQSYVVVFLELNEPSPAPRYQLKVRVKGAGRVIWRNDRLVFQKPGEIRVGLPVKVLKPGKYELELLALEGDTIRRVGEYDLVVSVSSGAPRSRSPSPQERR